MAAISMGMIAEELAQKPALLAIINTNSPLQLDGPMAEGIQHQRGDRTDQNKKYRAGRTETDT